MSRHASLWKPSFAAPAIAKTASRSATPAFPHYPHSPWPPHQALASLAWFVAGLLTLSLLFSLLALPWVELSWWRVFRRCVSIAAALSLWWRIRRRSRETWADYGLGPWAAGRRQLGRGMCWGAALLAVLLGLGFAVGLYEVRVAVDAWRLWRTVLGFLPAALLVGLLEELVFRGFLLRHLASLSQGLAVVVSSVVYAAVHLKELPTSSLAWQELGGLTLLGLVLALSCLWTRQLYLAIGLHAVLAYGARVNKLLLQMPEESLYWLSGTSRLVNGVLAWLGLLVLGGWILWQMRQARRQGRGV